MLKLMQGVVEEGNAASLRYQYGLTMDIAGKTGTTQDHADGWFIGITPNLVTGVWVGAESPLVRFRTLALGQGAATALPVWGDFMVSLTRDSRFKAYRHSQFRPLPSFLEEQMDCDSFIDDSPEPEEEEGFSLDNLLERIFEKRDKGDEEDDEQEKQEEEEEKQREEALKAEEKEQRKEERRRRRLERELERQERDNN